MKNKLSTTDMIEVAFELERESKIQRLKNLGFEGSSLQEKVLNMIDCRERTFLHAIEITHREIIIRHTVEAYKNGISIEIIAKSLKIPESTVKDIVKSKKPYDLHFEIDIQR